LKFICDKGLSMNQSSHKPQKPVTMRATSELPADVLSNTISHIYSANDSNESWPYLIEGMLTLLGITDDEQQDGLEGKLTRWLEPHLKRVLAQQAQLIEQQTVLDFQNMILDRHPLALGLCDTSGEVLWANQSMQSYLRQLSTTSLNQIVNRHTPRPRMLPIHGEDGIVPLIALDVPNIGPTFVALVATARDSVYLDKDLLKRLFQLTETEVGIAQRLAAGTPPDEIAALNGTGLETVRGQVKNLMHKMGSNRQPELVARLLSSPASLSFPRDSDALKMVGEFMHIGERRVGYAQYGAPDGIPVFFMHSIAGSRLQVPPDVIALHWANIRLIAIERAGMGLSDFVAHDALDDCPRTVAAVADHLGIERFAVMGYSFGHVFALSCAATMPERVTQVFLVSPFAPITSLADLAGMPATGKVLFALHMRMPSLGNAMTKLWLARLRRDPSLYIESMLPQLAPKDAEVLLSPEVSTHFQRSLTEGIHLGDQGTMQDINLMVSDWGKKLFAGNTIHQPITVWHGNLDCHIPLRLCVRLCEHYPQAELHVIPESGHYVIYHHWAEIVRITGQRLEPVAANALRA
jgi:pimeloyl-ACP methyl ester carboxylesterase/DNA-binding CsgD family transcriptional regulator